jgi:hypothetical protein
MSGSDGRRSRQTAWKVAKASIGFASCDVCDGITWERRRSDLS